ncbi:nuclear receptor ROR-gamma isoform X2 [Haemorhous mexicanus]|uniref:nuclear receptor ROR-gamma isoform X2 n=1 Tax=Haemorhous mexicanus TaxID=30427 RepID=UPI0028BD9E30|nr:nuclear receptor ROR-gamma isoform X2 [Haemorhous mexicanus]
MGTSICAPGDSWTPGDITLSPWGHRSVPLGTAGPLGTSPCHPGDIDLCPWGQLDPLGTSPCHPGDIDLCSWGQLDPWGHHSVTLGTWICAPGDSWTPWGHHPVTLGTSICAPGDSWTPWGHQGLSLGTSSCDPGDTALPLGTAVPSGDITLCPWGHRSVPSGDTALCHLGTPVPCPYATWGHLSLVPAPPVAALGTARGVPGEGPGRSVTPAVSPAVPSVPAAVKFGRMSKKQRDRLQAEVLEQLEKRENREKNREQREQTRENREQTRENREQTREQREQTRENREQTRENREQTREKWEKGEKREEERAAPGPPQPPPAGRCPPLSPAVPAGCPSRAWPAEEVTKRGQDGDRAGTAGTGPIPQPGAGGVPESPAGLEIELLTQSVLLSHRATCHPRAEDLQGHRWATFSPEEIRAYQSQPMAEMWQRCARRVTEAIERVVEFAKRLRGFLQLSQHDQIVLLKAGAMEVVLLRMCRAFDAATGTVLFEGKLAGPELFRSLGRPWLQDRQRVARLQGQLDVAFRLLLRRTRREGLLARLPAPGRLRALCSQHLEQVQAFRRLHPAGVSAAFPPLYRELFAPDPADGPAGTR